MGFFHFVENLSTGDSFIVSERSVFCFTFQCWLTADTLYTGDIDLIVFNASRTIIDEVSSVMTKDVTAPFGFTRRADYDVCFEIGHK